MLRVKELRERLSEYPDDALVQVREADDSDQTRDYPQVSVVDVAIADWSSTPIHEAIGPVLLTGPEVPA